MAIGKLGRIYCTAKLDIWNRENSLRVKEKIFDIYECYLLSSFLISIYMLATNNIPAIIGVSEL